jgi:hypothetical protein
MFLALLKRFRPIVSWTVNLFRQSYSRLILNFHALNVLHFAFINLPSVGTSAIEERNGNLRLNGNLLVDLECSSSIGSFGQLSEVKICQSIRQLSGSCFAE